MENSFDVIVIGGGPGGYVAAIRAAQLGLSVAVVEKQDLGGVCLNWGCIPTKALLRSAEVFSLLKNASEFGINISSHPSPNMSKMVDRSRAIATQLSTGVKGLMKKNGITVFYGTASFISVTSVIVDSTSGSKILSSGAIIIATGASARVLEGFEPDDKLVWTYMNAMIARDIPKTLVVIGAGAIGLEFASFYSAIGTKVTVIESHDRILHNEDVEVTNLLQKSLELRGISFILGSKLVSLNKHTDSVDISLVGSDGCDIVCKSDKLLVAVGVSANISNLALYNVGVNVENSRIRINGNCETNVGSIYAIGDVASTSPCLAHKASHEGVHVAEVIAVKLGKFNKELLHPVCYSKIPSCVYTSPQVASVGLTEVAAVDAGYKVRVGRFKPIGNGKAIAMGETEGIVKVVFDESTGELLGSHLCGAEVTEMIQGFVIAQNGELTENDLIHSVFPHPTMSEMMHEAVLDAYGRVLHM